MLQVVVHEKGGRTQRFNFEGDSFTVGRGEDNDLVLDRPNISTHHLRLRRRQGKIEVIDLQSTNGTYVNGRVVPPDEPRTVQRSDRIYIGDFILMLEGDDPAIRPLSRGRIKVEAEDGTSRVREILTPADEPLLADAEGSVITSAARVASAGVESSYLDRLTDRVIKTMLENIDALDPTRDEALTEEREEEARRMVAGLVDRMQEIGELEEGVDVAAMRDRILRELLETGPLGELVADDEVMEIQVVGGGYIRVLREGSKVPVLTERRFSGDRALGLAIRRLAKKWGFWSEGAQVLEGKVDAGFYMYALLPPTHANAPVLSLRRTKTDASTLEALVHEGVLSLEMREVLRAAIAGTRRVLICASGGTNLDRFMGAIVGEIPEHMRVACISDTGRLGAGHKGWVQLRRMTDPADGVGLSDSLGVVLRGGLDLLVSQRCRHEDAAAVLDAIAGAASGAIVSMWGIDSAHAMWRLAGLSTVAAGAIHNLTVSLARSLDLLVRLAKGVSGEPMQVIEIVEPRVTGSDEIVHMPIFRAIKGPDGATAFQATGTVPAFVRELGDMGVSLPTTMFKA
ncbi:MAG: FHA domain-containing protein [Deltaproteobacteria bacterium]|nr:MAG: FHA domain-containing protein [Deltaproteobacteria bacterium]